MNRQIFFSLLFCVAIIRAPAQHNILLVIADDLGKDYCGFYTDHLDTANMPNLRALVSNGMRFTNAWSNPVCSPTRAGILTGRYSFRTGVGDVIDDSTSTELDTAEITIPKLLGNSGLVGYATANVGKWHLHRATARSRSYPNRMGYDYYAGNFLGALPDYFSWTKIEDGQSKGTIATYATTETVNDAVKWLSTQTKSWFLWLAFNAPHTPFHKPPDSLYTVQNLSGTANDINRNPVPYFKAMCEAMDSEFGRLIDFLKSRNMYDNTEIIFIGDNGNAQRVAQTTDTNRAKGTLYQYGINVPFVVCGPTVVTKNSSSDALVNTQDIFATALELGGELQWQLLISKNKPVDSRSMVPVLKNEAVSVRDWVMSEIFSSKHDAGDGKTIRDNTYKLLRFDDGREEFYNLAVDPAEHANILLRAMNSGEQAAYHSLCDTLSALTGITPCSLQTSVEITGQSSHFRVWPDPASSVIRFDNEFQGCDYGIINNRGEEIYKGCLGTCLSLGTLSSGVYHILVRSRETWQQVNVRIIK